MSIDCKCPLATEIEVGFFGRKDATVVFVGESPGKEELIAKRPFVGRSGKLLRSNIEEVGISKEIIAFANSARCLVDVPKLKAAEIAKILKECRPFLEQLIYKLQPKAIVPLGDIALKQVLRLNHITRKRGKVYWSEEFNCWVLPMLHPAHILRNMSFLPLLKEDLSRLNKLINANFDRAAIQPVIQATIVDSIEPLLERATHNKIRIGFDTETQGLDYMDPESYVISYSVGLSESRGYQVFLYERVEEGLVDVNQESEQPSLIAEQQINYVVRKTEGYVRKLEELKRLLEHPNILIYMQRGVFDLHHIREMFLRAGMVPPEIKSFVMDIQSAAHCLDENAFKQSKLDTLAKAFCNYASPWKDEFARRFDKSNMICVPQEDLAEYAVEDACVTRSIAMEIRDRLSEEGRLNRYFTRFVMPSVSQSLYAIEANGIFIDQTSLPEVKEMLKLEVANHREKVIRRIPAKVLSKYGDDIKLTQGKLIKDILFSDIGFGLTPPKMTKKGEASYNKDTRAVLLTQNIPKEAKNFILSFKLWSDWHGLLSRSLKQITEYIRSDGRVHSNYSSCQAVTGRISSSGPNLMNIVARSEAAAIINKLFSVPDDSWEIIEADLSQAELRLIAHESGDPAMRQVYLNDEDIHTATAKVLTDKPWDSLTDKERKHIRTSAKPANFGIVYGSSAYGFANYCLTAYGLHISIDEAERIMAAWFNKYKQIKPWHQRVIEITRRTGSIQNMLGRIRRLPDIHSEDKGQREAAERQAINFRIQGPSSDMGLMALFRILQDPDYRADECKPILFVHDSLGFQTKRDKRDKYATMIKYHMEHPPLKELFDLDFSVPMKAELSVGPNRAELKSYEVS